MQSPGGNNSTGASGKADQMSDNPNQTCLEAGKYDNGTCNEECSSRDPDCFDFEESKSLTCFKPNPTQNPELTGIEEFKIRPIPEDSTFSRGQAKTFGEKPTKDAVLRSNYASIRDKKELEEACTYSPEKREINCSWGLFGGGEAHISLEKHREIRETSCRVAPEGVGDVDVFYKGTVDPGTFASEQKVVCGAGTEYSGYATYENIAKCPEDMVF